MRDPISNNIETGTSNLQETSEPLPLDVQDGFVLDEFLKSEPVYWHPLNSREKQFERWLDKLAIKNREAFRETLILAEREAFLADRAADWEQTQRYLAKILAAVAAVQQRTADEWLSNAKIRLAAAEKIIERDAAKAERQVLAARGVIRGRR